LFKNNCIPFGLFKDFITFYRKNYKHLELNIDPEILKMYKGDNIDFKYDLKFQPYPYQQKSIENAVKFRNGLFLIATAGGKSVCLAYIFKNLYDNKKITNLILVVPTINLVNQFKSDMIDYGIDENLIGECYGDIKEWNKTIVIST
jgi:superfamily II DNA or RNA helicase